MFIHDQGCLLGKSASGENNLLLSYFLRENGLKYVLARKSSHRSKGTTLPDLFETGQLVIEQKDASKPAFLKDHTVLTAHPGIGRSYSYLQAASSLTRFYERNLVHMEHFAEGWDLLQNALEALSGKPCPEAVLLKTLFLFARSEGYPVVAHWLKGKTPQERAVISGILNCPLEDITIESGEIKMWIHDLNAFFKRETDLLSCREFD